MKKLRIRIFVLVLGLTLAVTLFGGVTTVLAHSKGRELESRMTGKSEIAGGDLRGRGTAEIRLNASKGTVCFDIDVSRLSAPITAAHIHQGAAGVNGPVVVNFLFPVNGLNNCVSASPALIQAIIANPAGYYTNVHTTAFPGGAIRGQLHKDD